MSDKKKTKDWRKLCGAWNDWKLSAEEIIQLIKESRVASREVKSLD